VIDESLRAFLLSIPGITAEVATRIYPAPLPQGATLPALTYTDISAVDSYSSAGPGCLVRTRYQIDHWARTREDAGRVERATKDVLRGYRGQWPGGLRIAGVFRRNRNTLYEPETMLHRVIADYEILTLGE
jgi:hypothetical protein